MKQKQKSTFSHAARALGTDVCYYEYGCFTTGPPFGLTLQRPVALLPDAVGNDLLQFLF